MALTNSTSPIVDQRRMAANPPAASGPSVTTGKHRRVLGACVRVVRQELSPHKGSADIGRTQRTLDKMARVIQSESDTIGAQDYERFLRRLSGIFSQGCTQRDNDAFPDTAASYAAVVKALSGKYNDLDYHRAIGQLLEFMIRLFKARNASWISVYKHLRSIPDSVPAKQKLEAVCSSDIHEWFDAGVQNLFSLQDDLHERIDELAAEADKVAGKIRAIQDEIDGLFGTFRSAGFANVVPLEAKTKERKLTELQDQMQQILDEQEGKSSTAELIESDIHEFEEKLRSAKRAYFVQLV